MSQQAHTTAAGLHDAAAKSHRAAAEQHGKSDHVAALTQSTQAHGHSEAAQKASTEAHDKSTSHTKK
jgi:hypothetical protein